jgi:hypothetical protein
MLRIVFAFLGLALVAAFFGFGASADYSWPGARNFFYFFLVVAALTFVYGCGFFRRQD